MTPPADELALAKRLCNFYWNSIDPDNPETVEFSWEWEEEDNRDGWIALAALVGPALKLPGMYPIEYEDGQRHVVGVESDWDTHVAAIARVWGEEKESNG